MCRESEQGSGDCRSAEAAPDKTNIEGLAETVNIDGLDYSPAYQYQEDEAFMRFVDDLNRDATRTPDIMDYILSAQVGFSIDELSKKSVVCECGKLRTRCREIYLAAAQIVAAPEYAKTLQDDVNEREFDRHTWSNL